jgi:hypothetical protein
MGPVMLLDHQVRSKKRSGFLEKTNRNQRQQMEDSVIIMTLGMSLCSTHTVTVNMVITIIHLNLT